MIDCLHNPQICLFCVTEEPQGLRAKMLLINPKNYPAALGAKQDLTIPKAVDQGTWTVVVPVVDESAEPIEEMHTDVMLPYANA